MMHLVYLANVPWDSFSQRPHMFVRWMHQRHKARVLWIDPYPSRFPQWSDTQRLRITQPTQSAQSEEWLTVLKPLAIPFEPLPASSYFNRLLWISIQSRIKDFLAHPDRLIVVAKVSELALLVLQKNSETASLYDAMDDAPAFFEGRSQLAAERRETRIADVVSRIWVSSEQLQRKFATHANKTKLVLNACQAELLPPFSTKRNPYISSAAKPVLGYVGTLAAWFDWPWVISLARENPHACIRLIGPVFTKLPHSLPENIELLPACSHQDALEAMQKFDVGLIPFLVNQLTESVDPIKYYEYRALGLPVISPRFGQMRAREGDTHVFFTDTEISSSDLVQRALAHKVSAEDVQTFRTTNDWSTRFESAELSLPK